MNSCEKRIERLTREALGGAAQRQTRAERRIHAVGAVLLAAVAATAVWTPLGTTATHIAKADEAIVAPVAR